MINPSCSRARAHAVRQVFLAAALAGAALAAVAQSAYPTKQVDITVPYAPGGGVDILARLIGKELGNGGQAVLIENKPGAGSTLGARYVAGRPADGHSLLMMNDAYSLAPSIMKSMGYDPKKDLSAVINVAYAPMLVVVPAASNIKTFGDLVKAGSGGKLNYGSCGTGTDPHLAGEMMNMSFKMKSVHVPYKGCGPALVDVLGGQVDYAVVTISGAMGYVNTGKMRALAITSKNRSSVLPDVPTIAESGDPTFHLSQWQGLAVPAATPDSVKMDVYNAVAAIMKTEAMQKRLTELGYTLATDKPAVFQKIVNDDIDRFADLAKKIGLTVE